MSYTIEVEKKPIKKREKFTVEILIDGTHRNEIVNFLRKASNEMPECYSWAMDLANIIAKG